MIDPYYHVFRRKNLTRMPALMLDRIRNASLSVSMSNNHEFIYSTMHTR